MKVFWHRCFHPVSQFPQSVKRDLAYVQSYIAVTCHHFHHSMQIGSTALGLRLQSRTLGVIPFGSDKEKLGSNTISMCSSRHIGWRGFSSIDLMSNPWKFQGNS